MKKQEKAVKGGGALLLENLMCYSRIFLNSFYPTEVSWKFGKSLLLENKNTFFRKFLSFQKVLSPGNILAVRRKKFMQVQQIKHPDEACKTPTQVNGGFLILGKFSNLSRN